MSNIAPWQLELTIYTFTSAAVAFVLCVAVVPNESPISQWLIIISSAIAATVFWFFAAWNPASKSSFVTEFGFGMRIIASAVIWGSICVPFAIAEFFIHASLLASIFIGFMGLTVGILSASIVGSIRYIACTSDSLDN